MIKSHKKLFAVVVSICLVSLMILAGCGSTNNGAASSTQAQATTQAASGSSSQTSDSSKPYEFSIFRSTWTELNADTDPVIQAIDKKLNVKINILTSPYETWNDKINLLVSSGDVPDIVVHTGPGTGNYNQWVDDGIFTDLTSLYPNYPNLNKTIPQQTLDSLKINGKIYFIPCPTLSDDALMYRADWAKNLGITVTDGSVTLDQFHDMLTKFTKNDPDKNGKKDTVGLLGEDTLTFLCLLNGAFGSDGTVDNGNYWVKGSDGQYQATIMEPSMKEATKYAAQLYKEGLIDPEWMLTKSQAETDKFESGKGGIVNGSVSTMWQMQSDMQKANPNATLDIISKIVGSKGDYGYGRIQSFWMGSSISSKAKDPKKLLEFLDYIVSPEGVEMMNNGIEGLTYTKDASGNITQNADAMKKYGYDAGGHPFKMMLAPAVFFFPNTDQGKLYTKELDWHNTAPIYDAPLDQLPSQQSVITTQGPGMIVKAITEMIIGKQDVDTGWDKMIQQWKSTGGDQLTKEVNDIAKKEGK